MADADGKVRITELLASLSLATDLATFQPLGHGLSTSLLAVALAEQMGYPPEQVRAVQQVALLRFLGCTSDAANAARMVGDGEGAHYTAMAPVLMGGSAGMLRALAATVGVSQPFPRRLRSIAAMLTDTEGLAAHCEVGAMLARRLGLSEAVVVALGHAYERWDGKGHPDGLSGEAIPPEVRITVVARDADLVARNGHDVGALLAARRGKAYDPVVVGAYARLATVPGDGAWEEVLDAEPAPVTYLDDLDGALAAVADFVDIKSPWTRGHSPRVADLAEGAATAAGLGPEDVRRLRRAALVHDLGRVGVENAIWDKPGPLATGDWEKVRLHSYLTQRILARCEALAALADLAASHHERVDGSGYHRAVTADQIPLEGRILAAADVMAALLAERPHRPGLEPEAARAVLTSEAHEGLLDRAAVAWVIAASGGPTSPPVRSEVVGGLTPRELEVLCHLARGSTNRLVAEALFISPKTVGRHVENIYAKIGVSTRAGATMFAMENRLLG
jgi:HD-GYP domain-containing protein (c-di-GMP phosphodiesterase class II)/DNA-binding CsgD family transcriptional regulator